MKSHLQVRKSGIHGRGLFTTADIKEGAIIGFCDVKPTVENNAYTLTTQEGDVDVTCKLKYINHSGDPNAIYYGCDFSVVALRDISAGSELTHDYGEDWPE